MSRKGGDWNRYFLNEGGGERREPLRLAHLRREGKQGDQDKHGEDREMKKKVNEKKKIIFFIGKDDGGGSFIFSF